MPEAFQNFADLSVEFLANNWPMIVSVALGILLYKVFKQGLALICFILAFGAALTLLTHMGVLPPVGEMLAEMTKWFNPAAAGVSL